MDHPLSGPPIHGESVRRGLTRLGGSETNQEDGEERRAAPERGCYSAVTATTT